MDGEKRVEKGAKPGPKWPAHREDKMKQEKKGDKEREGWGQGRTRRQEQVAADGPFPLHRATREPWPWKTLYGKP